MTRVFPDACDFERGSKRLIQKYLKSPNNFGTNKDENKFFNSANPNFVEWIPAKGLFKTAGIDLMPARIIDPEYYEH